MPAALARPSGHPLFSVVLLLSGLGVCAAGETAAKRLGGGLAGARPSLAKAGIDLGLDYTAEVFGVVNGGVKRGAVAQGLANLTLDADLEQRFGWPTTTAHLNIFDTRGRSISEEYAGDVGHLSNIEFVDSTRLFECWIERAWPQSGWSVRVGQLALDAEFASVAPAAIFCNSDFGACGALSANVPVPIFAVAAPGLRLRRDLAGGWFVQTAVYDGNPAPDFLGDPSPGFVPGRERNLHGWRMKLSGSEGALLVIETGCADDATRGWAWRAGAFYHTDTFSDQRFDAVGRSRADPASDGKPRGHRGDYGAYAVAERTLWRREQAKLEGFVRGAAVPDDRNVIGASWETGLTATGVIPRRPADAIALGVAGLEWSRSAAAATRDANRWAGATEAEPDAEIVVELTWRAQVNAAWAVQPDLQWIRHPGGSAATADALALGLRTYLSF